jgi:outer membrane receptor for ferrienterochelin and colicins
MKRKVLFYCCIFLLAFTLDSLAQANTGKIEGRLMSGGLPVHFATVVLNDGWQITQSDSVGYFAFRNLPIETYTLKVQAIGYNDLMVRVNVQSSTEQMPVFELEALDGATLSEVVVSGTLHEVSKLQSVVPVEVYNQNFFKKNPTPSLFESLQNINGVRPQLNCSVCNTGDIRINGLEGPYTMVLIDGMPIVSGLSTVYGLMGIPQSLIERVEIVKGPASTLYGSEAIGGLVNIITKQSGQAPVWSADVFTTSWQEWTGDFGGKLKLSKRSETLVGLHAFHYNQPIDNNSDGLTDMSLQQRYSLFQKTSFVRKSNKRLQFAARYLHEDRWGGQMNWTEEFRGGDSIYGESIYTKRWEVFGEYELPFLKNVMFHFSGNGHAQNSMYGTTSFIAQQNVYFGQLTWRKKTEHAEWLVGSAYRHTFYDDNSVVTRSLDSLGVLTNLPSITRLPGVFVQHEWEWRKKHKLLSGMRYDHNNIHGHVFSPRLNYKYTSSDGKHTLRAGLGNGYRVASIFTEDHAALTGAREVVFEETLRPEKSWNQNINYTLRWHTDKHALITLDVNAFHTRFSQRIIPDYETHTNKIIYGNLDGFSVSKGLGAQLNAFFPNSLKVMAGATLMDVSFTENGVRERQLLTERFSGVWSVSYTVPFIGLTIDYTGNVFGPMRMPLLGELDPRSEYSPVWSLQNIQFSKAFAKRFEVYTGIKNLLDFTPDANSIARAFDPFDQGVTFNEAGEAVATPNNPFALTFDPTYMYAPNIGRRLFIGLRWTVQ